jgi:hypothetical protein
MQKTFIFVTNLIFFEKYEYGIEFVVRQALFLFYLMQTHDSLFK